MTIPNQKDTEQEQGDLVVTILCPGGSSEVLKETCKADERSFRQIGTVHTIDRQSFTDLGDQE
jgi:hypothetical protein